MANKTIAQLSTVATVADIDEFEVQVSGETVTKKCTRKQLTQIEETARIAQDDVIEAAVGLNTNGTYKTLPDSWYLRAADFATGITDRGGAEGNVVESIEGGLRLLDSKLYESVAQLSQAIKTITVELSNADILSLNAVPKVLIPYQTDYVHEVISIVAAMVAPGVALVAYEAGTDKLAVRYSSGGSTIFEFPNAFIETATKSVYSGLATSSQELGISRNIELYCATPPTTGNGIMQINITYRTHLVIDF